MIYKTSYRFTLKIDPFSVVHDKMNLWIYFANLFFQVD